MNNVASKAEKMTMPPGFFLKHFTKIWELQMKRH